MDRRAFLGASLAIGFAPPALAQDEGVVRMRDLYNKNLSFSDYAKSMGGSRVSVQGYMAPPLKADSSFFVLTKRPMAVCPLPVPQSQARRRAFAAPASRAKSSGG